MEIGWVFGGFFWLVDWLVGIFSFVCFSLVWFACFFGWERFRQKTKRVKLCLAVLVYFSPKIFSFSGEG